MTAKPAGLPALSRTAVGREVIIQDFLPYLEPQFRMLMAFVNLGVDADILTSEDADDFGNERAREMVSTALSAYVNWTGLKDGINPDDLNSLIEEVSIAASAMLATVHKDFTEHMKSASEDPTEEEDNDK